MAQSTQPISPLRQRMIEDMHMRKLAPKTQASYICAVKKLADYLGHSPHTATAEDLRQFQLHLTDQGTSRITINTTITALRFFFEVTVGEKTVVGKLKTVPVPRKLPVVLSREHATPPGLCCGCRHLTNLNIFCRLPRISERQLSGKIQFTR